jgi:predicted  nucleic acid-binding Zn-ribbon protein
MIGSGHKREDEKWSGGGPHEEFLELSALSTSGELSEQEQKRLQDHVATCPDCRQALREFEAVADVGVPLLSSVMSTPPSNELGQAPREAVEATLANAQAQIETTRLNSGPVEQRKGFIFAHRNGNRRTQLNWNYVWMPFAAAVLLTAALGIYSYQVGRRRNLEVTQVRPNSPDTRVDALEQQMSDMGHEHEVLKTQLAERDQMIRDLRRQIEDQSSALAEARSAQANLEQSLQNDQAEKQQVSQERNTLTQKFDTAQASLQRTQTELDSLRQQRSQDQSRADSLEAQIRDLHGQLRDREQTIGKQDELLAHDRDIRDLMGARDLYIAEVYDVARDGATQKPYGRVFYTKGKSLIFYAYDLDQQPGVRNAGTFQAWGRGGADKQQALSLGIFYQDSGAKKRWVLKFEDTRALEHIDAVFVTVEPKGGSQKPSGKPLLFASLKIEPNHP